VKLWKKTINNANKSFFWAVLAFACLFILIKKGVFVALLATIACGITAFVYMKKSRRQLRKLRDEN